jgi:hypothetical protein
MRTGPRTGGAAILNQLEDTMPVSTHHRRTRPNSAPAYYLGRPASFWVTQTTRRKGAPDARRQIRWTPTARQAA